MRAFEAIARLGSVTWRRRSWRFSPSAVSHQLKVLEGICRSRLPNARGAADLSQHGREYYRSIRAAFNVLRRATEHLVDQVQTQQVTISPIPLFGMGWFIPASAVVRARQSAYRNQRGLRQPPQLSERCFGYVDSLWQRSLGGLSKRKADFRSKMVPVCSQAFCVCTGISIPRSSCCKCRCCMTRERNDMEPVVCAAGFKRPPRSTGRCLKMAC